MRIGTIGTSKIAEKLITTFIEAGFKLEGVTSRSIAKAKSFQKRYGFAKAFDDYDKMLEDDKIDIVYIALPNALHFEYAKKALLADKNVILEKPFCISYEESLELYELAKSKRLFLFEAITSIHLPIYRKMKEDLLKLGPVKTAILNMTKYSSRYDEFKAGLNPNIFNPKMGGGALMDLNVYNIHIAVYLFGMPLKMVYLANIKDGVDTSGVISMKYEDKTLCLIAGKDAMAKSFLEIMGENGYIYAKGSPSVIKSYDLVQNEQKETFSDDNDPYLYEIMAMKKILENDDHVQCERLLEHTLKVMKIIDDLKKADQ